MNYLLTNHGYTTLEGERLLTSREAAERLGMDSLSVRGYLESRGIESVATVLINGRPGHLWLSSEVRLSKKPENRMSLEDTPAGRARVRFVQRYGKQPFELPLKVREWSEMLEGERHVQI